MSDLLGDYRDHPIRALHEFSKSRSHNYDPEDALQDYEIAEEEIYSMLVPQRGAPIARVILRQILEEGLIQQTRTEPVAFELTKDFANEAGKLLRADAAEQKKPEHEDEWAPLPLERNHPAYEPAVANLERVIDAVEGDNGFAAIEPENREIVVSSLRAGLDLIKNHIPDRKVVHSLVLGPLNWLKTRFAEAAIGELAKQAVVWLLKWLAS